MNLNQRKRLAALTMALTMGVTILTGCGGFKYEKQDNGIVVVTGEISYDDLKKAKLVHITNEIAELDEYYLALYYNSWDRLTGHFNYYKDVETDKLLYAKGNDDFKNFKIEVVLDGMVDYLYKYDMVKDEYSIDDVVTFREQLLTDETLFPTLQSSSSKSTSSPKVLSRKNTTI